MKKLKAARIDWVDSSSYNGWREEDKEGPVTIRSIGWIAHQNPKFVVLTTSISSSDRLLDQLSIPRSCIKKISRVP